MLLPSTPQLRSAVAALWLIGAAGCGIDRPEAADAVDDTRDSPLSTSSLTWEAGTFRQLGSMPQPDGYDLDKFVADPGAFPHVSSYSTINPIRFGKVKALLTAILSASRASLADPSSGDWCGVRSKAAAAGYQVRRFYDTESGHYLVYGRDTASGAQQAYFFVNPSYRRNLVLEAPHEPIDPGTAVEAARLFRALAARSLIVNGSHRCGSAIVSPCSGSTHTCGGAYRLSDVAHHPANAFEALHEVFDGRGARFAQIHQMSLPNTVVVGDGTANTSDANSSSVSLVAQLRRVIDPAGSNTLDDRVCACQDPNDTPAFDSKTGANGCFSTNLQGRYTHLQADPAVVGSFDICTQGSQYGADRRMLLVEQATTMIDGDCSDGYCWTRLAQALRQTWACSDGSLACTWGSRQAKVSEQSCP
jgi:hypothetical protein